MKIEKYKGVTIKVIKYPGGPWSRTVYDVEVNSQLFNTHSNNKAEILVEAKNYIDTGIKPMNWYR